MQKGNLITFRVADMEMYKQLHSLADAVKDLCVSIYLEEFDCSSTLSGSCFNALSN